MHKIDEKMVKYCFASKKNKCLLPQKGIAYRTAFDFEKSKSNAIAKKKHSLSENGVLEAIFMTA